MTRRRLRLPSSSDEEESPIETLPTINRNPPPPALAPAPAPAPAPDPGNQPVDISDEDFVDVPEFLAPSPPSVPQSEQVNRPPNGSGPDSGDSAGNMSPEPIPARCPVDESLWKIGLRPRREWLDSCISGLMASHPGFAHFNADKKAKLCFEQFLFADMNSAGDGCLPPNVHALHSVQISGPFVLQVDEIVNLSSPLRDRYKEVPAGFKRCLKLSMTDGAQRVFGIEYRPIRDLAVLAPAGLKIAIQNVFIRRGLLMLVPEVLEVLGGLVEYLDAAHQRLVHEVNKPPRGKRNRNGELPSLVSRIRLAAWPPNNLNDRTPTNLTASLHSNPPHPSNQVAALDTTSINAHGRTIEELTASTSGANAVAAFDTSSGATHGRITEDSTAPSNRPNVVSNPFTNTIVDVERTNMSDEMEHPIILTGDNEIPFTYMACLLAKWTANKDLTPSSQGKIKCFLTGVKGFQFKERPDFDLVVYIDDGSLISEVRIDHRVVQRGIGHSPGEVTAALSSSEKEKATRMRETMKQFQLFLAKFEGTMLVEINEKSPLPLVLEMNQGCPPSDAWLLLRRLKMFTAPQTPQRHQQTNTIDISP